MKNLKNIFKPIMLFDYLANHEFLNWMPSWLYLKIKYRFVIKKRLNLRNPKTFNEKLQWLKLHDKNPLYTMLVDKYEVKEYIAKKIGEEYLIPTIGVWNNADEIDFDTLPEQFVLKTTHDSGTIVICKDRNTLDIKASKEKLSKALKRNYYYHSREWAYKNVKPRIIAEEYMVDESGTQLKDYKFFCFDGEVKALYIVSDRGTGVTKIDFFDSSFNHLPIIQHHYPNADRPITKPASFEKMKELATKLSKGYPFVRADFYDINGKIYFGELTFFPTVGMIGFEPKEWDRTFGYWIDLSKAYCYRKKKD